MVLESEKTELLDVIDENDRVIGQATRGECHQKGLLHCGVNIYLFNAKGLLLTQKRSKNRLLNPGKWDRSVAGHVLSGTAWEDAARRELEEETGIVNAKLHFVYSYRFREKYPSLIENELYHTFACTTRERPRLHDDEVEEFNWVALRDLVEDIQQNPSKYSKSLPPSLQTYLKAKGLA